MWNTHFAVHEDETASVKPCSVTSSCDYCGDQVPYNGQTHIAKYHLLQTFVFKLCQVGKYFYRSLDGVPVSDLTNIVYPGTKRNLLNFSWVRCKRCAVSESPPLDLTRRQLDIRNSVTLVGGWSTS